MNPDEPENSEGMRLSHVFLIVLVLHVLIIGGAVAWHWMGGGETSGAPIARSKPQEVEEDLIRQSRQELARAGSEHDDADLPADASAEPPVDPMVEINPVDQPMPHAEDHPEMPVDIAEHDLSPETDVMALAPVQGHHPIPMTPPSIEPPRPMVPTIAQGESFDMKSPPAAVPPPKLNPPVVAQKPSESAKPTAEKKPASKVQTAATSKTYKVSKGDNLTKIAKSFGTTVAALKKSNNLKSDTIMLGQTLKVPSGGSRTAAAKTKGVKGDKPESRSLRSGTYVVSKGDTLGEIAKKHKVTAQAIAKANGIDDPNKLLIGQKLSIPGAKEGARTTEVTASKKSADASPTAVVMTKK